MIYSIISQVWERGGQKACKGEYSNKLNAEKRVEELKEWEEVNSYIKVCYDWAEAEGKDSLGQVSNQDPKKARQLFKAEVKELGLKLKDFELVEWGLNEDYD